MAIFHILKVTTNGATTLAVLPLSQVLGNDQGELLNQDYRQLAATDSVSVELDLRSVEFIDGRFFVRLLDLRRTLQERSIELSLLPSPHLSDVLRITRLDRVFLLPEATGHAE